MKKMENRILSAILVFGMIFSLISPSVAAADTEQTGIVEEAEQEITETVDDSEEAALAEDNEETVEGAAEETALETTRATDGEAVLTVSNEASGG
ncbi:MAG: hypothetical protein LUH58_11000, partial [Lachnospiraceae bacterium]|nr:hypothetical protein [Lachnospiraceae bacterium]